MGGRRTFGTVRQLPSGAYQARYVGPDGQRVQAPTTFQARIDADAIISQSRSDGERLREELRQKAKADSDTIVRNAERQIQLETGRALQQIRHEAVDLSVAIASKLIGRNLSKEDNQRLIDDTLSQVETRKN